MPIDLGLSRVTRLLQRLGNPHISTYNSIHIAGTNGKGSTIAYLSSIFTQCNIRNGRFTSPHIVHYNDCICINNEVYPLSKFEKVNELVVLENDHMQLGCTEFELLTVTAFKIFELEKVELAIIEVGLGGKLDATNVLELNKLTESGAGVIATAITKIGIDHENLLGSTIREIATQKAGIIKQFIPCVADKTNQKEALEVISETATSCHSELIFVDGYDTGKVSNLLKVSPLKGIYQSQNLAIALKLIDLLNSQEHKEFQNLDGTSKITDELIKKGIENVKWQGRLQTIIIPNTGLTLLLDGAHNESAAIELGKYLSTFQDRDQGLIFIIAVTKGKDIGKLLKHITNKDTDKIIITSFTVPENMPWISSLDVTELKAISSNYVNDVEVPFTDTNISNILNYVLVIKQNGDKRKVVVCGSLYLCSDVLRYLESFET